MGKGFWDLFGLGGTGGKPGGKSGRAATGKAAARGRGAGDARAQALDQIRASQDKVMTPEREQLIRQAMEVRRAKQAVLKDLDDEQRQKLVATAMRAFLNEGRSDKK